MTITELLNKIKSAVYGSEVRLAIHDAIKKAYDDAAEAGNANMEVEMARGTEPTLNDRLVKMDDKDTELTAQLAQKPTKAYVDTNISTLDTKINSQASGSPKGVYTTLADLQAAFPTGNANIYLVSADGNWYYWNDTAWTSGGVYQSTGIASKSIDYDKTDFITIGKNLYNPTKNTKDYFVNFSNGQLVASDVSEVSEYIRIDPNTTYTLSNQNTVGQPQDLSQLAFFDVDERYVSGIANTGVQKSITFTTGSNVYYVRISVEDSRNQGIMLEKGSVMTTYEEYLYRIPKLSINADNIDDEAVSDKNIALDSNIVVKQLSKNLINPNTLTPNAYIDFRNGNVTPLANYYATDFILVDVAGDYTWSVFDPTDRAVGQLAFYDEHNNYVSGLANDGILKTLTFTVPTNVTYVRLSLEGAYVNLYQLEKGSQMTSFEKYGYYIDKNDLPTDIFSQSNNNVITVKQDGTGDFTTLRTAVDSITDASASKPYEVHIHEGVYDIFSDYTTEELNNPSFVGLLKPDYVDFIGVGDKENIWIKGEMPLLNDVISAERKRRISPIWPIGNGTMENLTVTNLRCQYAIHDDYNVQDSLLYVKNCAFKTFKSSDGAFYGGKQPWGEGSWGGQRRIFEDCTFDSEWDYFAYTTHNTAGQRKTSYHKFINCKFNATLATEAIRFQSLDGQEEIVDMIGTKNNSGILIEPIAPFTGNMSAFVVTEMMLFRLK